jgi:hypothetical protein
MRAAVGLFWFVNAKYPAAPAITSTATRIAMINEDFITH